jgi:hypothetical protein
MQLIFAYDISGKFPLWMNTNLVDVEDEEVVLSLVLPVDVDAVFVVVDEGVVVELLVVLSVVVEDDVLKFGRLKSYFVLSNLGLVEVDVDVEVGVVDVEELKDFFRIALTALY